MLPAADQFMLAHKPVSCTLHGNGHIHETYLITDEANNLYILQKINTGVFRNPEIMMNNIALVTQHLKNKANGRREVLSLVPTKQEKLFYRDSDNTCWRVYDFVRDTICLQQADTPDVFKESAFAFGRFASLLSDFPAQSLAETIPDFHNTPLRYKAFIDALNRDVCNRAKDAAFEIEFALRYAGFASTLTDMLASGALPLRVTHNDTKLNNVLFDMKTCKAICVIDLDTVMPGLLAYDFGDSIRFGASTAAEDETDLDKVEMSLDLFSAYLEGYLEACGSSLTPAELEMLPVGAKMMTLECGVRFLTDYLSGDTYFKIHRPNQNLDRCRTQFKLVADMDKKWDKMNSIVRKESIK